MIHRDSQNRIATPAISVLTADRWDPLLDAHGITDTYLRSGWIESAALLEDGASPRYLHFELGPGSGGILLALLVRPVPGTKDHLDATTPYGYGGPVAYGGSPDPRAVGHAWNTWSSQHGIVASFLRFHPLLGNASVGEAMGIEVVPLGHTVAWDLAGGRDLEAAMHPHHRRAVRKARRQGVTVEVLVGPHPLHGFRGLYDLTMRRQQATGFYFFPDSYWRALGRDCGGKQVLVEARLHGEIVASLLCVASGRSLHYHLGASDDRARTVGASNLAFLEAARWGRDAGCTRFHLGGGVGAAADTLFQFKHRYDPASAPLPFSIGKVVHDRQAYFALAGTHSTAGFFPPWRARGLVGSA